MQRKAKRNPMPAGRHEEVMRRDNWCCRAVGIAPGRCGGRLEVNHVAGRGMGGSARAEVHDLENLMTLCSTHHAWVEQHPREAMELGLKRRR